MSYFNRKYFAFYCINAVSKTFFKIMLYFSLILHEQQLLVIDEHIQEAVCTTIMGVRSHSPGQMTSLTNVNESN